MAFEISKKPMDKPSAFDNKPLEKGLYKATVEKVEYKISTKGNWMLTLVFKTEKEGRFVYDQIMDNPAISLGAYKLNRLLSALGINITGEVELKDMVKVITKGKKLVIAAETKEDSKYANIEISKYEAYYPYDFVAYAPTETKEEEVDSAPEPAPETTTPPTLDIQAEDEFF